MGDVVEFSKPLLDDHELIADLCRFSEGVLSEAQVRKKHRLADSVWQQMGSDDEFVEKIENEKIRRVRDGSSKRELAQKHVVKAPDVLSGIMLDASASPKHRIDSAKVLDTFAANGPQAAPPMDRFVIRIDISGGGSDPTDVLHFDKPLAVGVDEADSAQNARAAITAKKKDDDSG